MSSQKHHGVCVIITNQDKSLFYIQQKDEKYPVHKYRFGYSLFGVAVNPSEDELKALKRELFEELGRKNAGLIISNIKKVNDYHDKAGEGSKLSLYEAQLPSNVLEQIVKEPVLEGRKGMLVTKNEITIFPFIYKLKDVDLDYLEKNKTSKNKRK